MNAFLDLLWQRREELLYLLLEHIQMTSAAVLISICTPRSSAGPHSGKSASDTTASLTLQASPATGVTMGICSC